MQALLCVSQIPLRQPYNRPTGCRLDDAWLSFIAIMYVTCKHEPLSIDGCLYHSRPQHNHVKVFILKTAGPCSLVATSLFFATLTLPFSSVTTFIPLGRSGSWLVGDVSTGVSRLCTACLICGCCRRMLAAPQTFLQMISSSCKKDTP